MEKREWKPIEGFNFEEILFEEYNHIAKVTINRPRYRNAFTPKTVLMVMLLVVDMSFMWYATSQ